ncbi:hypothetical protein BDV33DRAFT_229029 [Aspergillus novoparasiticus]|uniref:Uncharacterized protein n=1 Tax=Aspergillus novoparasiticus TaxID=986946 RepID=A0A5N6F0C2_9EURO|nr:hypothetical protein BDV33DRAFT_229029 [Aspergillus novoparasiticus]
MGAFLAEQAVDKWPPREDTLIAFRIALSYATMEANPIPEYGDLCSVLMTAVKRLPEQSDRLVNFTRRGFANANVFTAKLYLRIPRPNKFGYFIDFGSQMLKKTLELAPWEKSHHPRIGAYSEEVEEGWLYNKLRDEELEVIDIRTLNGFVPAAAVSVEYCGKEIHDKGGYIDQEIPARDKWNGPAGSSKERWAFWKERFEWISTVTALDRQTRKIARSWWNR